MDLEEIEKTELWQLWQKGVSYNQMMGMYTDTDKNYRFYNGDQWKGLKSGGIEPVSFNVIKPIVKHQVGTINQNLWAINYSSDNFDNEEMIKLGERICSLLNKRASRIFEKDQMDYKLRKVSKQSAINDEGIIYVDYEDETDDPKNEIINKTDVCFGNENSSDIQSQPYIIIKRRLPVVTVREIAEEAGVKKEELLNIVGDNDTLEESGEHSKYEVDDMCSLYIKMFKKEGSVHFSRATKYVDLEDNEDTGLTLYPLAHMVWEEVEGYSRGIGIVKHLIPNQIEINKTLMRRALTVKQTAYPQKAVLIDTIVNPEAIGEVGSIIKVQGMTVDDVRKAFSYTSPAQMSSDATNLQNELIQTTRDLNNSSELATGNVNPEDASGRAILAVQQASNMPLGEQTLALKTMIEDLARIYLDMWKTYAEKGLKVIDEQDSEEIKIHQITTKMLEELQATVRVDITPKSPYDKFAVEQSIENLFMQQKITFEEYVKLLPEDSVMPKQALEQIVKDRELAQQQIAQMQAQANQITNQTNQIIQNQEDIANIEAIGNQMAETTAM